MSTGEVLLIALGGLLAFAVVIALIVAVFVPLGVGVGRAIRHVFVTFGRWIKDIARAIASLIVAPIFAILALLSLLVFQPHAARRFTVALRDEGVRFVSAVYRVLLRRPAELFGVEEALDGIETRLPGVVGGVLPSEWTDAVTPRTSMFAGYEVEGTLPQGGSGAKLYVAKPTEKKNREFAREGLPSADRVVIKSFSTLADASLPQIVRESRALDAGKRMGLIYDHGFGTERFFYVMRYVPGVHLREETERMHRACGEGGLDDNHLRLALWYARDLVATLASYHAVGLWHKDVKPDNVIVEPVPGGRSRAVLVDIGLVSSLRSAMTLTTHGTEYYRDPEMVRMALKGVKVGDVDGRLFDIYGAGAVIYSMIEDSFPAQGVLSPTTKRCPPSVGWIIRRAMADYRQRYQSADDMLADLDRVLAADAIDTVRPAHLPSQGGAAASLTALLPPIAAAASAALSATRERPLASAATAAPLDFGAPHAEKPTAVFPSIRVTNWWTGEFEMDTPTPAPAVTNGETKRQDSPSSFAPRETPRDGAPTP